MFSCLSLHSISKTFGRKRVVSELSFTVEPGEIFGLLGPNGAGKTTTLRMILDLLKPDQGEIQVFGGPLDERKKDRIGYMPEERGLYGNMRVLDCLVHLGTLKNLSWNQAAARAEQALKEFELWEERKKKIEQLSRGMAQKAQIIAATLHAPDLLVIDEPFANLDPVNVQVIQTMLLNLRAHGKSVIMSSHQLHLVEALCDRLLLLNRGRAVVYGPLRAIQQTYAKNQVRVSGEGDFSQLPGVTRVERRGQTWELTLVEQMTPARLFHMLSARSDLAVEKFEVALPTLDEIFVQAVTGPATDA